RWLSLALHNLGLTALKRGDHALAREHLLHALRDRAELGDKVDIAYSLEGLAALDAAAGNLVRAVRMFGSAEALRAAMGVPEERAEEERHQQLVQSVRTQLPAEHFETEWTAGKSMQLSEMLLQVL